MPPVALPEIALVEEHVRVEEEMLGWLVDVDLIDTSGGLATAIVEKTRKMTIN